MAAVRNTQNMHHATLAPALVAGGFAVLIAGCTVIGLKEVPVVDRSTPVRAASVSTPAALAPVAPAIGAREASDGVYTVQRGDTLYSVALAFGQDWRDVARWNQLDDPTRLRVGQTLRVVPPASGTDGGAVAVAAPVVVGSTIEARPLDPPPAAVPPKPAAAPTSPPTASPSVPLPPPPVTPAPGSTASQAPIPAPSKPATVLDPSTPWAWPASGPVLEPFDDPRNKGIDIGGKEGDPVIAANDGQVVYVGDSLRGYGNLVIVKHNDDYISAYAHNRKVLVQQGQSVKRGQRVAELGSTGAPSARLHFEIRRQGKPVDPQKYLPAR